MVARIDAAAIAKERARVILENFQGSMTVAQACAKLGIEESQFHALRNAGLRGLVEALEPKPRGRPPALADEKDVRIAQLERAMVELKADLKAEALRGELAVIMPHVLQRKVERSAQKKGVRGRPIRKRPSC